MGLIKTALCTTAIFSALLAEPSVYGRAYSSGGDASLYSLRQQVAALKEEVEGLKSIVQGLSDRMRAGASSEKKGSVDISEIEALKERVARLEKRYGVTSSKSTAAPKAKASSKKSSVHRSPKSPAAVKKSSAGGGLESAKSSSLYSRGVILFDKKQYAEAKKRFEILLRRNYKPAASNFYMGEIAYRSGRYRDAIKYYQKSAELNENAAYMDRLLLHTGISLENEGEKEQAKKFYQAIVDAYPGTSSAKVAKKRLR